MYAQQDQIRVERTEGDIKNRNFHTILYNLMSLDR